MIEKLLHENEGKTLEFKENTKSLAGIIKTIIAFCKHCRRNPYHWHRR